MLHFEWCWVHVRHLLSPCSTAESLASWLIHWLIYPAAVRHATTCVELRWCTEVHKSVHAADLGMRDSQAAAETLCTLQLQCWSCMQHVATWTLLYMTIAMSMVNSWQHWTWTQKQCKQRIALVCPHRGVAYLCVGLTLCHATMSTDMQQQQHVLAAVHTHVQHVMDGNWQDKGSSCKSVQPWNQTSIGESL